MKDVSLASQLPPVPLMACWNPGPANGYDPVEKEFVEVGDRFLVLVHCVQKCTINGKPSERHYWDPHVITATETGWDNSEGDAWGSWSWSDVSWFLRIDKEMMPQL